MIARCFAPLLVFTACDVSSTVGYDDSREASSGDVACGPEGIARCDDGVCGVSSVFAPPAGATSLAVDATHIFFLPDSLSIDRRTLDGSETTELAEADSTLMAMTSDATHLYWTELDGNVRGIAKTGGTRFEASYVFGNPTDITVDSTHLYWIFPQFGQIAMATKPTGDATHITGEDEPQAVTTDASYVYWVNAGTGPMSGELVRAKRGDLTTREIVLAGLDAPVAIAASDDAVYWASNTAAFRLTNGATTAETVTTGLSGVKRIGVYGATLYGVGMDGLWRVATTGGDFQPLERRPMSAMALTCDGVYASAWFESAFVKYGP